MSKIDIPDALVEQILDFATERVDEALDDLMEQIGERIRQALAGKRPSTRRQGGDGTKAGRMASHVLDGKRGKAVLQGVHPLGDAE